LHLEKTKGSIGPGMDADLLILTRNPLNDINNIKSVDMVIKHGHVYQK